MSTTSRMSIGWDRGDQMGLLPPASEVVYPEPKMTIAWEPLTTPTIFDYDPADLLVTPGAGEEASPPPGETGTGGGGRPTSGGEPPAHHFGRPHIVVPHRRSEALFLKEGLFVDVHAPAPARVRAVLRATVHGAKGKLRKVDLTKLLVTEVGTEAHKLQLHPSRGGRRALHLLDGSVPATLNLVVRYGGGEKPLLLAYPVKIVGG
jgi:hypothetical protein